METETVPFLTAEAEAEAGGGEELEADSAGGGGAAWCEEVEGGSWGAGEGFLCRRCKVRIAVGGTMHLVARAPFELPELMPLITTLAVGDCCLRDDESGYRSGDLSYRWVPPPLELTAGSVEVLVLIGNGVVYRRPRRINAMVAAVPHSGDRVVTTIAYALMRMGLATWEPVDAEVRTETGPSAWAVLTAEGRKFLEREGIAVYDRRAAASGTAV